MKKLFLFIGAVALSTHGFAQRTASFHSVAKQPVTAADGHYGYSNIHAKTTGNGDTTILSNISMTDTLTYYQAAPDSGFLNGINGFGDMGFAERYDFNGADSALQVIGVFSTFGGVVNPASTKTVNFKVWSQGPQTALTSTIFLSGTPANVLDSAMVPVTSLGISPAGDTEKGFLFPNPTANLTSSFFVGYTINYDFTALNGDTIALYSSLQGERTSPVYNVSGSDTIINVQNATQFSNGTWNDNLVSMSLYNDLAIYPIVVIHYTTGVTSVTNKNLTFFGNYPNPANNSTNIQFSLTNNSDVTVQVMDISGHIINTIVQQNLSSGTHTIPVQTAGMAAGNYIYTVHTSTGGGVASTLSVVK